MHKWVREPPPLPPLLPHAAAAPLRSARLAFAGHSHTPALLLGTTSTAHPPLR